MNYKQPEARRVKGRCALFLSNVELYLYQANTRNKINISFDKKHSCLYL